jgi:hypothetical protein
MQNLQYVSNVLFLLLVIGTILLISSVKSISAGYAFTLFGLLGLLVINILFVSKENIDTPIITLIIKIISNNAYIVGLIGVVSWLLTQVITHYKKIIDKKTPVEYNHILTSSTIVNVFLCIMLYMFLNDTYNKSIYKSGESIINNKQMFMTLYILLLSMQYLLATFQYIILNYYSTDG